jgi:hypothetical protein
VTLSYKPTYVLILATAISLVGMAAPTPVRAAVPSRQPNGGASKAQVGDAVTAASQNGTRATADDAWTATRQDEATGFTEAASAYDPDSTELSGADNQVSAAANKPQDKSSSHTKIPEPSTLVLFGTVLIGIGYAARKRTKP